MAERKKSLVLSRLSWSLKDKETDRSVKENEQNQNENSEHCINF